MAVLNSTTINGDLNTSGVGNFLGGLSYITTAPTSDNTSGGLIIVVLPSEPATKYNGYLYLITL